MSGGWGAVNGGLGLEDVQPREIVAIETAVPGHQALGLLQRVRADERVRRNAEGSDNASGATAELGGLCT